MSAVGLWAALLPVLFSAGQGSIRQALPPPSRYVADYADVVDASQEDELNGTLQQLELTTGIQVIILTTPDTRGESLPRFAKRTAVQWKLRQPGRDRGLLFVLVPGDKAYCFEMGPDLRVSLTDSTLEQAGDDVRRYLQEGKVSEAVYRVGQRISERIASQRGAQLSSPLHVSPGQAGGRVPLPQRSRMGWGGLLIAALVVAGPCLWLGRLRRRRFRAMAQQPVLGQAGGVGSCHAYQTGGFGGGFGAFGVSSNAVQPAGKD